MEDLKNDAISFRIAKKHKEQLKLMAKSNGLSIGTYARFLILKHL